MDELEFLENEPDFYEIIPEYDGAGRQHEIMDGIVVFNEALEPSLPDDTDTA